ncbi:hypothetical protein HMPREF1574_00967 [Gardnerella pickettii JCP7659]|nr:hypothetical protein HMPREF1574_00967 [Gardnerella pickettii JCP7659]
MGFWRAVAGDFSARLQLAFLRATRGIFDYSTKCGIVIKSR